jgi:hypothetical protein
VLCEGKAVKKKEEVSLLSSEGLLAGWGTKGHTYEILGSPSEKCRMLGFTLPVKYEMMPMIMRITQSKP